MTIAVIGSHVIILLPVPPFSQRLGKVIATVPNTSEPRLPEVGLTKVETARLSRYWGSDSNIGFVLGLY